MNLDNLTGLRQKFTGESWAEARQRIRQSSTSAQMSVALAAHRHSQSDSSKISSRDSAAVSRARACLLPDANSLPQRLLETALLLAIRDCQGGISSGPYRGHKVFRVVSPRRDVLMVDLVDEVVERFLRSLLPPRAPSPSGSGIPGLRLVPTRRHLRVHLLNRKSEVTDACVIIRGIDLTTEKLRAKVLGSPKEAGCVDPILDQAPRLSPGELEDFDLQRWRCGPVVLGSMMLRRIGLINDAFALDVWDGDGGTVINVEISNGPSTASVLDELAHPIFGLIDGEWVVAGGAPFDPSKAYPRIIDRRPTPDRFSGRRESLLPSDQRPSLRIRDLPGARNESSAIETASTSRFADSEAQG